MRRLMIVCLLCLMIAAPLAAQDDSCHLLVNYRCLPTPLAAQDNDPYAIALQLIEVARESNATELELGNWGLTELPPEIGQLNNLQRLELNYNHLVSLPPEIGQLSKLQKLAIYDNELMSLPPEIGQLSNLQSLFLGLNQLTTLPPEIGQLSNLELLLLDDNHLTKLPPEIGRLSHLCHLSLGRNNLQHLPPTLGNLRLLTESDSCFATYYTSYNSGLLLDDNPLISPPPEVVEQGTAAVLTYLRNQAWYHTQRLIIGAAGGVGLFVLLLLGFRWKQRGGRKPKQKLG